MVSINKLLVPGEPFPGLNQIPTTALDLINNHSKKPEPIASVQPTATIQPALKTEPIMSPVVKVESATNAQTILNVKPVVKTETIIKAEPVRKIVAPRETAIQRTAGANYSRSADQDWVHDLYEGDRSYSQQDLSRGSTLARHRESTRDERSIQAERLLRERGHYRPNTVKTSESSRRGEPSKSESSLLQDTKEHYGRLSRPDLDAMNPTKLSSSGSAYQSQEQLILKNTAAFGIARRTVEEAFEKERARVRASFPNKSSDWRKWAV
jgi:hypothetical protein